MSFDRADWDYMSNAISANAGQINRVAEEANGPEDLFHALVRLVFPPALQDAGKHAADEVLKLVRDGYLRFDGRDLAIGPTPFPYPIDGRDIPPNVIFRQEADYQQFQMPRSAQTGICVFLNTPNIIPLYILVVLSSIVVMMVAIGMTFGPGGVVAGFFIGALIGLFIVLQIHQIKTMFCEVTPVQMEVRAGVPPRLFNDTSAGWAE